MVWPYAMIVNLNQSNSQPQLRAYRNYYKHSFFARTVSELKLNFLKVRFCGESSLALARDFVARSVFFARIRRA